MKRTKRPYRRTFRRLSYECFYCKQKVQPDYKEPDTIKKNISERGKILPRKITGVCQKHQTKLSIAVKRARFLALLPFLVRPS